MFNRFIKLSIFFISAIIFCAGFHINSADAAVNLDGRILLQVQDKGQAWYVNPLNSKRYYLGRPNDAFLIMRSLGLGVSNSDLNIYLRKAPARLAGRILLQVQDKGQAYYVDPIELKLYYLGRPNDAYSVMRKRGLGITNHDLESIAIASSNISPVSSINNAITTAKPAINTNPVSPDTKILNYTFKYKNISYELIHSLSSSLYNSYKNSTKTYSYYSYNEPANLRESFYALFFNLKSNDKSLDEIIIKLNKIATDNKWSDDELLEFVVSFVQYIPYDREKLISSSGENDNPYFPYETLYLDKGVCSDKTFLAIALLRKLGYGVAILDFPDINHSALGFACPKEYSVNGSGYCYGETTNYFPLGVIPQNIDNGQAETANEFGDLFNTSKLGKIEIYQKSSGKIYQGIPALKKSIEAINSAKNYLVTKQSEMDSTKLILSAKEAEVNVIKNKLESLSASNQISEYNNLIPEYNNLVNAYNSILVTYKAKVDEYNLKVKELNDLQHLFYQQ